MVTFKFREVGDALGTRQLGAQVRERLLPLIESNDKVVLDFEGVSECQTHSLTNVWLSYFL